MRALLISREGITEVTLDDDGNQLADMYRLIGCHTVCGAGYPDKDHACWADDEGLFHITTGTIQTHTAWYPQPLVGNLLITGITDEGETAAAALSVSDLEAMIQRLGVYV